MGITQKRFHLISLIAAATILSSPTYASSTSVLLPKDIGTNTKNTGSSSSLPSTAGQTNPSAPNPALQVSPEVSAPIRAAQPQQISKGTYTIQAPSFDLPNVGGLPDSHSIAVALDQKILSWNDDWRRDILRYIPMSPNRIEQSCKLEPEFMVMGAMGISKTRPNAGNGTYYYRGEVAQATFGMRALCPHSFGLNENLGLVPKSGDNYVITLGQTYCTTKSSQPSKAAITSTGKSVTCVLE